MFDISNSTRLIITSNYLGLTVGHNLMTTLFCLSFRQYVLNTYAGPRAVLGDKDTAVSKIDLVFAFIELIVFRERQIINKQ